MVKQETIVFQGRNLVRSYSDVGKYIIQDETGDKYEEAVDPEDVHRTYTESNEYIDGGGEEIPDSDVVAALEEIL